MFSEERESMKAKNNLVISHPSISPFSPQSADELALAREWCKICISSKEKANVGKKKTD